MKIITIGLAQKLAWKNTLKQFCHHSIQERITLAQQSMKAAQEAANAEEKSSAGDKYETGRAMSHLQKDMQARQLAEYMKELAALHAIEAGRIYEQVEMGSFVQCSHACFFLGTGLGKQQVDGQSVVFLSHKAPLALNMLHKKRGDTFVFNGTRIVVEEVF